METAAIIPISLIEEILYNETVMFDFIISNEFFRDYQNKDLIVALNHYMFYISFR